MPTLHFLQFVSARWVYAEDRIIENGGVVIEHSSDGLPRILRVVDPRVSSVPATDLLVRAAMELAGHAGKTPQQFERLPDRCLGEVVLLPAMVNCHTHLEFSDCRQPLGFQRQGFSEWLRSVIERRAEVQRLPDAELLGKKSNVCWQGWREMVASGVGAVGEILSRPTIEYFRESVESNANPAEPPFFGTIFHEVLGLVPERARASWEWANVSSTRRPIRGVKFGLSPHAPYSTSTWLYRQCAEHGRRLSLPVATHIAESEEELQLLSERLGPLKDFLEQFGVWRPEEVECRNVRDVLELLVGVENLMLVHANYLTRDDWCWLRSKNPCATIVYCPQTHHYFGHPRHPWVEMARDGLQIALGTDSRASSRSLSLWDDLQLVHRLYPDQDPKKLWQMATVNGANALGLGHDLGSIRVGSMARFCVADLGRTESRFSWESLLSSSTTMSGLE
ncbi:MAG: amidohydrolase family protein [Planctomycetaceae bacterium]|nr:amidohydrolase family protein [Planctomycetaceae bacterium]